MEKFFLTPEDALFNLFCRHRCHLLKRIEHHLARRHLPPSQIDKAEHSEDQGRNEDDTEGCNQNPGLRGSMPQPGQHSSPPRVRP